MSAPHQPSNATRLESVEQARARLEAEGLSEVERHQLWRRIAASETAHGRTRRRTWGLALGLVPALITAAVILGQAYKRPHEPFAGNRAERCTLQPNAGQLELPTGCAPQRVQIDGDEWLLAAGAHVQRSALGPLVVKGRVRFEVRPRVHDPLRVEVSHGQVVVIGTAFEIEQGQGRGSISVSHGVIEFVWRDGARERVAAGQRLVWPRVASAAPTPPLPAPTPTPAVAAAAAKVTGARAPTAAVDLERVMERLLLLRSQARTSEAIALLRETLQAPALGKPQGERISYELGLLLEVESSAACAHWRQHVARFGSRRHTAELSKRLQDCQ
jgi:ferric-dicitrate binding protein FerR (iron transport regulator)